MTSIIYPSRLITPEEALIPGNEMYKGDAVPWSIGIVGISMCEGVNKDNANDILGLAAECLDANDKTRPTPTIEFIVAHNPPNLDLGGSEADYVRKYDYLGPLLEKHKLKGVFCFFNGYGTNAHMVSNHKDYRDCAEAYGMAVLNIARRIGIDTSTGPGWLLEHMKKGDVNLKAAVPHLQRIAEYAAKYGITICGEPLRSEETDAVNTTSDMANLVKWVEYENFLDQFDSCHRLQGDGPDLAESTKEALKIGCGHYHASKWKPWLHPENRGPFILVNEGDDRAVLAQVDPVSAQLENIMMVLTVNGFTGSVNYEGPHIKFKDALGQGDPYNFAEAPPVFKDRKALVGTWTSIARLKQAKDYVEQRLRRAG